MYELSLGALERQRTVGNWTYSNLPAPKFERGYTGHEYLAGFDLVNMNGRMYDPMLGRFLSPDPTLQAPDNLQNYNRYSYVLNNPLKYTDPTGYQMYNYGITDGTGSDLLSGSGSADSYYGSNGIFANYDGTIFGPNGDIAYSGPTWSDYLKAHKKTQTAWVTVGFYYHDSKGNPIVDSNGNSGMFWIYEANLITEGQGLSSDDAAENKGGDQIFMDANHNRIGFVPLDVGENYGAYQMANYRCNISVRGNQNQITIRATSSNTPVSDAEVVFGARASLVVNGNITQTQVLANGLAVIKLPSSPNTSLTVSGGWTVRYDYGGAAVPVFHPIFWPFSLNFTDNFKLK